jgi:hypothetical protein
MSLTGITVPAAVTSIECGAFRGCTALTSLTVDAANEYFETDGKALYYKGKDTLLFYAVGLADASYALPASLKTIWSYAFCGCAALANIDLPASLTSIEDGAFEGCTGLTGFAVDPANKSFETDGKALFDKGKATLLYYALGLTDSTYAIPAAVTSIREYAFYGCAALTSIDLPTSLTSIGSEAFKGCASLNTVNYAGTKEQWGKVSLGSDWYDGCTLLTAVTCSDGSVTL